jgi:hypothetical protein
LPAMVSSMYLCLSCRCDESLVCLG